MTHPLVQYPKQFQEGSYQQYPLQLPRIAGDVEKALTHNSYAQRRMFYAIGATEKDITAASACLTRLFLNPEVCMNSPQLEQPESETSDRYLDTVVGNKKNMWSITIQLQGKQIVVKVDTGAEVTAISDSTWKSLNITKPLEETGISLHGPDNKNLKILGKISLALTHDQRCCTQDVYIIKDLKSDLLGLPAIKELELLLNVCSVGNGKSIISQYPSLFTGLGTFACEYTIKLKPNSQPFALTTPRNIPYHCNQKLNVSCNVCKAWG